MRDPADRLRAVFAGHVVALSIQPSRLPTAGWALVALQLGLAAMNIRGLKKNDVDENGR
ncbi:hypothetical protein [Pseudorhodoferax sp.]|uniref:hypothetical protein n=1 Tax=Pseudorhodoferax sp. TaxID=1993553 RepID=UPI002DD61EB3|nr:hypothetical protein [Pseudorhodoferax sp.]